MPGRAADALVAERLLPLLGDMVGWRADPGSAPPTARRDLCPACPLRGACAEMYPHIPICMHQDHGNGPATCATAIQFGFTSVMMDGSLKEDAKTPADYDYNVDASHAAGLPMELLPV